MRKVSDEIIRDFLILGGESRTLEFKSRFSWNDKKSIELKETVVRSILAMSNTPTGGTIIIGVKEKNGQISADGVSGEQLETFKDQDEIKKYVEGFASPYADFGISWGEYGGNKFVLFEVKEFMEMPVICKNDGKQLPRNFFILKKHAIYTRSIRAPISSQPATELELREMIRMAVDKEKTQFTQRGWRKEAPSESISEYGKKEEGMRLLKDQCKAQLGDLA